VRGDPFGGQAGGAGTVAQGDGDGISGDRVQGEPGCPETLACPGFYGVIVGTYLTTLGRNPAEDLALLEDLEMPIKALSPTL